MLFVNHTFLLGLKPKTEIAIKNKPLKKQIIFKTVIVSVVHFTGNKKKKLILIMPLI